MKQEPKQIELQHTPYWASIVLDRYGSFKQFEWSMDLGTDSADISILLTPDLVRELIAGLQEVLADMGGSNDEHRNTPDPATV